MPIPRIVIVAYRPKPGQDAVLAAEVRDHHPLLRSEGLATDRKPVVMQAADNVIVEMFEWASADAIAEAHHNPRVQAMWKRFAACCDYVPLNALPETANLFAEFGEVVFSHERAPDPPPSERAE
jgi:hypothetical protein